MSPKTKVGIVLAVQLLILAAVPGRRMLAAATGRMVTLNATPVDPYDQLSGYYTTLSYDLRDAKLPEGSDLPAGTTIYCRFTKAEPAWLPGACSTEFTPSSGDSVTIAAETTGGMVAWRRSLIELDKASRFYIAETERDRVAAALRDRTQKVLVDIKVGDDGTPVPVRLHVGAKSWSAWRH